MGKLTRVQLKTGFNLRPGLYSRKYGIYNQENQSLEDVACHRQWTWINQIKEEWWYFENFWYEILDLECFPGEQ